MQKYLVAVTVVVVVAVAAVADVVVYPLLSIFVVLFRRDSTTIVQRVLAPIPITSKIPPL
jgi:hypothetical protein